MPLSVQEYRIGQLYMVVRVSERESDNSDGDGVEVLCNEPFSRQRGGGEGSKSAGSAGSSGTSGGGVIARGSSMGRQSMGDCDSSSNDATTSKAASASASSSSSSKGAERSNAAESNAVKSVRESRHVREGKAGEGWEGGDETGEEENEKSSEAGGDVEEGYFTHKIYHLNKKLPSWVAALIPRRALRVEERSWNAYPHCSPFFGKFLLRVESLYTDDRHPQHNALSLSPDVLARRTVETLDIAEGRGEGKLGRGEWGGAEGAGGTTSACVKGASIPAAGASASRRSSGGSSSSSGSGSGGSGSGGSGSGGRGSGSGGVASAHPSTFVSTKTGRGPFTPGWQVLQRRLSLETNQAVVCWMDEWVGLSEQQVRALEDRTFSRINKELKARQGNQRSAQVADQA
ncbi:hypothetical protein CLOM_g9815 [Closterium sp. NIES-68]|nr:hypothetical protein CLOM_g9815 [Closterium sp. NIES-68]GJP70332.1 hypothetical protein CLOP_g1277 [Closterium sp. NIES-67]